MRKNPNFAFVEAELDELFCDLLKRRTFRRRRLLVEYALRHDRHDILGSIRQRNGKHYAMYCLCPFHNERTASFRLLPDGHAQCFGCGYRANFVVLLHDLWIPHSDDDLISLIREFTRLRRGVDIDQLRLSL